MSIPTCILNSISLAGSLKSALGMKSNLLSALFKFGGRSNQKIAKLGIHKVLGAQFKCFVDYKSED